MEEWQLPTRQLEINAVVILRADGLPCRVNKQFSSNAVAQTE